MKIINLLKLTICLVFLFLFFLKAVPSFAAEITIDNSVNASNESQKGRTLVWTTQTTGYFFYVDVTTNDLVYVKTTNGGRTWGAIQTVNSGSVTKVSVWYDKWTTGDSGTKIHIGYLEVTTAGANAAMYRDLDTSGDTLGTDTVVNTFGGGAASWSYAESEMSLTKSRGGNLYIAASVAAGVHGFYRCTGTCNSSGNWSSRTNVFESSVTDGVILMPGGETDNQDILALYWDYSADEISLKTYDDSGNSFAETSISTSMVENSTYGGQWSASQRQSDDHIIFAAWNALDTSTADLKVWDITNSSTITAKTNIITDQSETALVSLMINQTDNTIYAAYVNGATWTANVDAVYKLSTDGGTTWSPQSRFSLVTDDLRWIDAGNSITTSTGRFQPVWFNDDLNDMLDGYAYIWDGGGGADTNVTTAANWMTDTAPSVSSDWIVFSGASTNNATIDVGPNIAGIHILPGYTGTITQGNGNDVTLNDIGYLQAAGTFTGGDNTSNLDMSNGAFSMYSGTFTAPAGTIYADYNWIIDGGTFNANGGLLTFDNGTPGILSPGNETYNDLEFDGNGKYYTIEAGKTFNVGGDLHVYTINSNIDGPGGFTVQGDIINNSNNGITGNAVITVNGTGDQYWYGGSGGSVPGLKIQKTSGTFYIQDTEYVSGGGWEYVSGNVDATTYASTVGWGGGNQNTDLTGDTTFYNIETGSNCAAITVTSGTTITVANNLTMGGGCGNNIYGPGIIEVQGNLTHNGTHGANGDVSFVMSGSNNQTITYGGTASWPTGTFTINKPSGTVTLASNFVLDSTGQDLIITSGTLDLAGFDLTVDDQFTLGAAGTLKLNGDETIPTIASIASGSTVDYAGAGTYSSLIVGDTYSNLKISGSGSFTPAANVTVSGSFTQTAGTFSVAPSGMTVSDDFTHTGGVFTPGSSTVTFDNSGNVASISGNTTFYNLTSITPGKTIRFASNSTTSVTNALTLRGSSEGLVTLESTDNGYQWHLDVDGTATLSKLSVKDSNACAGSTNPLTTTGSADGGNNSCWTITGSYTDWYNHDWSKRRAIIIDHTKVDGDLTDFPFLFSVPSDTGLAADAQDDGDDILFTTDDGTTKLSHEIEKFDGATGEAEIWVKIPNLSSTSNTTIYLYYGNSGAANQEDPTNVWDSNYKLVQHFDETSGTNIADSTSNNNDGTKTSSGNPASTTGQIDGAQDFSSDSINANDNNSLDITTSGSVSMWAKRDTIGVDQPLLQKLTGTTLPNANYFCFIVSTDNFYCGLGDGASGADQIATSSTITSTSTYYYLTFTWNSSFLNLYINGALAATPVAKTVTPNVNGDSLYIGEYGGVLFMDGVLDEVRVSNTDRSAEWTKTEYNNQSSPSTFFSLGVLGTVPVAAVRGGVKILPGTKIHTN